MGLQVENEEVVFRWPSSPAAQLSPAACPSFSKWTSNSYLRKITGLHVLDLQSSLEILNPLIPDFL